MANLPNLPNVYSEWKSNFLSWLSFSRRWCICSTRIQDSGFVCLFVSRRNKQEDHNQKVTCENAFSLPLKKRSVLIWFCCFCFSLNINSSLQSTSWPQTFNSKSLGVKPGLGSNARTHVTWYCELGFVALGLWSTASWLVQRYGKHPRFLYRKPR